MCNYLQTPELINIEVTDKCPLNCPQCYCKLNVGKDINKDIAINIIRQAGNLSVKYINISGGETLLYPYLLELISTCSKNNILCNIAISGWNFSDITLSNLIENGIHGIFVSLNGSTNTINSYSRNGYNLAINALQILSNNKFNNTYINWVMQYNNVNDFPNIIKIAEYYNVKAIVVLCLKPNSKNQIDNFPSKEQFEKISVFIRKYTGNVKIIIDKCFSQLKAFLGRNIFTNINTGLYKGCTAGLNSFTLNVDGNFSPCRHLFISESFSNISDYWFNSPILKKIKIMRYYNNLPMYKLFSEKLL